MSKKNKLAKREGRRDAIQATQVLPPFSPGESELLGRKLAESVIQLEPETAAAMVSRAENEWQERKAAVLQDKIRRCLECLEDCELTIRRGLVMKNVFQRRLQALRTGDFDYDVLTGRLRFHDEFLNRDFSSPESGVMDGALADF